MVVVYASNPQITGGIIRSPYGNRSMEPGFDITQFQLAPGAVNPNPYGCRRLMEHTPAIHKQLPISPVKAFMAPSPTRLARLIMAQQCYQWLLIQISLGCKTFNMTHIAAILRCHSAASTTQIPTHMIATPEQTIVRPDLSHCLLNLDLVQAVRGLVVHV